MPSKFSRLVVSPRHGLCLPPALKVSSVCFLKVGEPLSVLHNAAKCGFWRLPRYVLEKLAGDMNISKKTSEVVLLQNIMWKLFPHETILNIATMLGQRGLILHPGDLGEDDIPAEALDNLVPESDQKDVQDFSLCFCL